MSGDGTKELMFGDKPLSSLRVVDLKEELEKRGLSKSGTKKDLAERLKNHVQLEIQKTAASIPVVTAADDEQLPNISMQEKLAEQNPFIRDYFASQAELFHTQKVAKKLLEEEARRESEASAASADEGGESSAAEDKVSNNSGETERGKVKKLARRFENQAFEKESLDPKEEESIIPSKIAEPLTPQETVVVKEMAAEDIDPKPSEEEENSKSAASSRSSSTSRSASPACTNDAANINMHNSSQAKSSESESESSSEEDDTAVKVGSVKRLTEKFEVQSKKIETEEKMEVEEEEKEIHAVKPLPSADVAEISSKENQLEPELALTSSRSPSKSSSRSPSPENIPKHGIEKPTVDEDSNEVVQILKVAEKQNGQTVAVVSNDTSKSAKPEVLDVATKAVNPPAAGKIVISPIKTPVKVEHSLNNRLSTDVRNQRRISAAKVEEMEDEDALDYGEEEKIKKEPAKFDWSRRILRLKSNRPVKEQGKKWTRDEDSKLTENINTEFLQQWFPEVKLVSASELRLEEKDKLSVEPEEENVESDIQIRRKISIESSSNSHDQVQVKMENIRVTRKVSLIPMVPIKTELDADLPPPRNPASALILVTNLVRPFTLPQLRELLQRTGTLVELWVDKIKSKCIAMYEKQEEAFETRAALHGVNWPQSNPKALHVDYATQELLDDYKARESGDVKPPLVEKPKLAELLPVREWDVGKRPKSRSPNRTRRRSRSESIGKDRKRPRRSLSPNRRRSSRSPNADRRLRMGEAKEHEPLGKALDELFRKTIATPSIYWLPLTPEQIAEKEELRRKRMIERERRLAEMNKLRPR